MPLVTEVVFLASLNPQAQGKLGTKSQAALHFDEAYKAMLTEEARDFLAPFISAMKKVEHDPSRLITTWDMHQLACHWKLHKTPG
jgi:hypothetical protein